MRFFDTTRSQGLYRTRLATKWTTVVLAWLIAALSTSSASFAKTLHIIHTNDLHGRLVQEKDTAGVARIARFIQDTRAETDWLLTLDAGDAISGTPVSSIFLGEPIFEIMNLMSYDLGLLGNHEFDHGYEQIDRFLEIANFPLISANAFNPEGELIADKPFLIKQIGDISVGIIGLTTPDTPKITTPEGNEGLRIQSIETTLPPLIQSLEPKVDVLIFLTHLGYEEDLALAEAFPSADLIVGGHSHTMVPHPIRVGDTWVVQADHYGKHVGLISLELEEKDKGYSVQNVTGGLVRADELPPGDPRVEAMVNHYEEQVAERVDQTIMMSDRAYSKDELQPILEEMLRAALDADLGFYNRGGIRDEITAGPVSARMIWNIEPFGNSLVRLTIKGSDLLILLSQEREVHHAAANIDPERIYQLATNSFIGSHAAMAFGDAVTLQDTGTMIRDVLINHIQRNGLPD